MVDIPRIKVFAQHGYRANWPFLDGHNLGTTYSMTQSTAVVLDPNQNKRGKLRMCLSQCGVLPICFDDDWICLENIYHIKPTFAVLRATSSTMAIHFIYIARAIDRTLPIIIVSDQQALQRIICKPWLTGLFFLSYPASGKDFKKLIESFGESKLNPAQSMLIAESPVAQQSFNWLQRIGLSHEPVLIQGEPGVGKKLIAETIYHCSAAKSKLWKHVSARDISGRWVRRLHQQINHLAPSGSPLIFYIIEKIEELSESMQSQLLLVMDTLKEKGNGCEFGMPVRFIFLAEADLSALIRRGRFRKDLYYRLTVLKIDVPPLRDRREDIPLLADFFTAKYSFEKQRCLVRLPEDIQTAFKAYDWPGNVAQLEGTIERAMALGMDTWADELNQWRRDYAEKQCKITSPVIDIDECLRKLMNGKQEMSLKTARQHCVMQVEKDVLKTALLRTHGNCKKAAVLLNISYKTMLNKVKAYRLAGRSNGPMQCLSRND